jgi:hypothetical protein
LGKPTQRPADFRDALSRLTGDSGERGRHIVRYRISVVTADGKNYGLRLSAGNNAKTPKSDITRLRRKLCLRETGIEIETILNGWDPSDLRAYIKKHLTEAQLEQYRGG